MSCWGMGITQSDEYADVYDRFMEEYNEGKPLPDIKQDILEDYLIQFEGDDGVLHDVYFAIGKAEWMCGGISNDIFARILHIIKTGENIAFYRELEATESDLKLRQKNLNNFLSVLSVPRGKTKKRKIPTEKYVTTEKTMLPAFRCGDIFAYEVNGKYRLLCLISRGKFCATYASYCYVWTKLYDQIPKIDALTEEYIMPLGYFTAETFPNITKLIYVGNMPDMLKLDITYPGIISELWKPATWLIVKEEHLSACYPLELYIKFSDCLKKLQTRRNRTNTN